MIFSSIIKANKLESITKRIYLNKIFVVLKARYPSTKRKKLGSRNSSFQYRKSSRPNYTINYRYSQVDLFDLFGCNY